MVTDALRNYVSLAGGLVEVSRQQAVRAARALGTPGEVNQEQIGHLAEELIAASKRNRDAVLHIVGHEIERARERLGVATAQRVDELSQRVETLESEVRRLQAKPAARETQKTAQKQAQKTAQKTLRKSASSPVRTTATKTAQKSARKSTGRSGNSAGGSR